MFVMSHNWSPRSVQFFCIFSKLLKNRNCQPFCFQDVCLRNTHTHLKLAKLGRCVSWVHFQISQIATASTFERLFLKCARIKCSINPPVLPPARRRVVLVDIKLLIVSLSAQLKPVVALKIGDSTARRKIELFNGGGKQTPTPSQTVPNSCIHNLGFWNEAPIWRLQMFCLVSRYFETICISTQSLSGAQDFERNVFPPFSHVSSIEPKFLHTYTRVWTLEWTSRLA